MCYHHPQSQSNDDSYRLDSHSNQNGLKIKYSVVQVGYIFVQEFYKKTYLGFMELVMET